MRDWTINPGITLGQTWSDNVAPNSGGFDQSDFITQINPELRANLNGRRIQADLDYQLQNILYARNDRSTTYQQYLARAGAEVLPEHFFIDTSSTLTQQIISTSGVRTNNNYTITDNRTDQLTASIRPSWHQSLGSNAESLLDYEHGIVKYDSDKVAGTTSDSQLDSVSLTANSLSEERRLSWKVNVADQRINYDDNAFDDLKIRHAGLLLGYQIIPGFSPLALIGYEDNDFGDNIGSTDPKGSFWGVGFRWQPNTRTDLEALAGHRFFGNTYRVDWRQRGRYLTSELTYTEEIQGEATSALESASLIDNPSVPSAFTLGVSGNAFLSKTVRASAILKKSKTSITVTPFYGKREFSDSSQDESVGGIEGTWTWDFASRTNFGVKLHWDTTDAATGSENQTFAYSTLQLQRRLGNQAMASLQYSYTRADSDDKQLAYSENAITAQLTYLFGTPPKEVPEPSVRHTRSQQRELQF
ncbi:MAG: TIGR03016 family PEP-CTERM system-associated outer membrane protein [Gammaproteobacteria bacterium]